MGQVNQAGSHWLVPLFGPSLPPLELPAKPAGLLIGRHEQCDIRLASDEVSRFHARLQLAADRWRLGDLNSRWGTFLNGCRLSPEVDVPLTEDDLIRITPWTFAFGRNPAEHRGFQSVNDADRMQTLVRSVAPEVAAPLASDLLALLLESAAGMHGAPDEHAMAEVILDAACRGTGLPNAALLRPLDASGRVDIVASRRAAGSGPQPVYSRSLVAAASSGVVAELGPGHSGSVSESIVQMRIDTAICVPLMLGSTVAAYLYLDSRSSSGLTAPRLLPSATAFCLAIGRIASLALANLKRIDIERRQAMMEAEFSAGAEAQRWVLPVRQKQFGPFTYIGESRPGRYVGGDFFDVIPLGDARLGLAVGDVSGKGIGASVLMTAAQGFLHAALREHGQPERALADLNQFVLPRRPEGKFITLWVGVFDAASCTLRYVDAGHGYAVLLKPDGQMQLLCGGDALPVGVDRDSRYLAETVQLPPAGRVLVVSDGIVEQPAAAANPPQSAAARQFTMDGVRDCLATLPPGGDEIAALFAAVIAHAATTKLADDATAVLVRW